MKKSKKIVRVIIVCWIIVFAIDFILVHNNKLPIFCIVDKNTLQADGGSREMLGLGYKVYKYVNPHSEFWPDEYTIIMGTYFTPPQYPYAR